MTALFASSNPNPPQGDIRELYRREPYESKERFHRHFSRISPRRGLGFEEANKAVTLVLSYDHGLASQRLGWAEGGRTGIINSSSWQSVLSFPLEAR